MGHRRAAEGHRVLVVAPYGRDAESAVALLRREGYDAQALPTLDAAAGAVDEHVGVLLLTEEALRGGLHRLHEAMGAQPDWSDPPFILLTGAHRGNRATVDAIRARMGELTGNAIVLERPLGAASLLSAVTSAMRARQKQFQMRDQIAALAHARDELAASEGRLRLATDAAGIGFWDVDPVADTLFWPPLVKAMFGISADRPVSMQDYYEGVHADDRTHTFDAYRAACDPAVRAIYDVEYRTVGKEDGVLRWVAAKGRGIFDADGRCVRVIGTAIDVTRRKAVEWELRSLNETLEQRVEERTAQLMQAEASLRQSHKMEAVGQLTGGIAHDFNNMLTGVIGAMDIMKRRLATGRTDDLPRFMDAAAASAQRAAGLTARLLAFSRRQSLDPRPIDVDALIASLEELLRRTINENIALRIVPGVDLPMAVADANQLESAILNLSINARDAMPDGGELTIESRAVELDAGYAATHPEVEPGRYVVIAITDTGVGMPAEVIEKVFDPFFTTKPIGQGTGLGLSMVYGFARQSGGQVRVHSQPGVGTTVSLYLRAGERVETGSDAREPAVPLDGDGQTVLLVEDDPSVRLLVRDVLEELSYHAIEAEEAEGAIAALASDRAIDLMISDVGLPGMNGRQLADVARSHRPDLPILFVTGYAENAAVRAGFLGTNMAMITKPFAIEDLSAKIGEMLRRQGAIAAAPAEGAAPRTTG